MYLIVLRFDFMEIIMILGFIVFGFFIFVCKNTKFMGE